MKGGYVYSTRTEFEHNFDLLVELMMRGQMHFSVQSEKTMTSLTRIRKLPNGRYDLNTIDELARTTAHMAGNMEQMIKNSENHEKK